MKVRFIRRSLKNYQKREKQQNPNLLNETLAKKFNIRISTISKILKNSNHWLNIDLNSNEANMKSYKFQLLENALMKWVDNALMVKSTITGFFLAYLAQEFANLLDITDFKVSEGWLTNFKNRANLKQFARDDKSNTVPLESLVLVSFREELVNVLKDSIYMKKIFSESQIL